MIGGLRALPPGAARGLGALEQECGRDGQVRGAHGQLLGDEGPLGSSALTALAPDGAGSAQGPRTLDPWRLPREVKKISVKRGGGASKRGKH